MIVQSGFATKHAETDTSALKEAAIQHVSEISSEIEDWSDQIWQFSELGLLEMRSSALLADALAAEGFEVERGVAGMPSAFVATYGTGAPIIGILAEYDALPGIGVAVGPTRTPRPDGVTNGHGCGHNLFGAGSTGGAIALKRLIEEEGLNGTIKLFGTPAEEDDIGKLYMAKAGVFDGLDVAIEWHPEGLNATTNEIALALNNFQIEFFGTSSHASATPEEGVSALDALEMTTFGINLLREHVPSTVRIHYVIADGGDAPNVVPDYARLLLNVRNSQRDAVDPVYARVLRIADSASVAVGTQHKVTLFSALHELNLNRPLQEAMQQNVELVGPPPFSFQDQLFAKEMQRNLGLAELGYDTSITPLADAPTLSGGSTDVAEVSQIAPTVGFMTATTPIGVPFHSWAATAAHGSDGGKKGAIVAAKIISAMGVDILTRPDLVEAARLDFERRTLGKPYQAKIPLDQKPPLPERK